jgi:hypothetical protein
MIVARTALLAAFCVASAAFATPIEYTATLSGPAEVPPTPSPGIGFADVIFDTALHTLAVSVSFSGLLSTTTASHIHCCTAVPFAGAAGVATQVPAFAGFPLGVTSGTYSMTFNTSLAATYNPAFITANGGTPLSAEAVLAAGMAAGQTYFNIHTTVFPGGEISGFLATPEPATFGLAAIAMAALVAWKRRRSAA